MQTDIWLSTFVPGARAAWPHLRRLRTAPGDPPSALERPGELASTFLGLFANGVALAATGKLLCPEAVEVQAGQPRAVAHEGTPLLNPLAQGLRQLLAQDAWLGLETAPDANGELSLWPALEPWLEACRQVPDGTRINPEAMAPYWTASALVEGRLLSARQASAIAQLFGQAAPAAPVPHPTQEVRP